MNYNLPAPGHSVELAHEGLVEPKPTESCYIPRENNLHRVPCVPSINASTGRETSEMNQVIHYCKAAVFFVKSGHPHPSGWSPVTHIPLPPPWVKASPSSRVLLSLLTKPFTLIPHGSGAVRVPLCSLTCVLFLPPRPTQTQRHLLSSS
jgi:hypothetical protein